MRFGGVKKLSASSLPRFASALLLALFASLALAAAPASATKTHLFQENFGAAAQPEFGSVGSLAVDQSTGDLLVIDVQALTVSRYHADGTPDPFAALATNTIDAKGSGKCPTVPADCDQTPQNGFSFGPREGEQQVAVDNSGTTTDGNIYVTQGHQAAGNLVDIFASSGKYLGQLTAAGATKFGTTGSFPFSPCGVAVDGAGSVYLAGGYDNKIYKFAPSANPPVNADNTATFTTSEPVCNLALGAGPSTGSLFANTFSTFKENSVLKLDATSGALKGVVDPGEDRLVSVDPASGHLFAFGGRLDVNKNLVDLAIREFDASGSSASLLSTTPAADVTGLAASGEKLYLGFPNSPDFPAPIKVYGPLVTIPDVTTGPAEISGDTSATLHGTVDPDGVPLEECSFEYGPTTSYGQAKPCAESMAEIGTAPKEVHADITGLTPEALYHYRLVAKNANATVKGDDKTFRTPGKPAILGLWSLDVAINEATLKAQLNPENSPTTYRFEWGTDTSYANATADVAIGSGNADHTVSFSLDELAPATTYHYRLLAENGIGTSEATDHTFTTYPSVVAAKTDCPNQAFRIGSSATLPDCRAFEMVSPVDKNGGDIKVLVQGLSFPARLDQSSADGTRFAFSSVTAFAGALSAPWSSEYLADRGAGGWRTEAINPPRESKSIDNNPVLNFDVQYKFFSPDLGEGWLYQGANPPLDACAPQGFINLYRRDNATGAYEALIPSEPPKVPSDYRLELQGVSDDGSHAVFRANAKLTEDAANTTNYQLYEHVRGEGCGELRLISLQPNGKASTQPATSNASAGTPLSPGEYRESTVARAVSGDGSRVVFRLSEGPTANGPLYIRINADQEQSTISAGKCSEADKGCTLQISPVEARFWTASTDDSRVVYSVGDEFFEFDVDKALAGDPASTLIAANARGIAGASEDGSRIYLVSGEQLGGKGIAGQPNLFTYEPEKSGAERYGLVATLAPGDLEGFRNSGYSIASPRPIANGVRLSPDGRHLAFVSTASLTGYDNTDAADGRSDLELYLYDADTGKLACVSCNPSGSRPQGRNAGIGNGVIRRVAAQMPPGESQTFAPRVLSEDGNSLFFESFEALLPRDVNAKADVYQWQRASDQSQCNERGAELYVPASGGCLSLISSGQSPSDSEIADASPDGSNVFIRTAESLLPQDPGQVDLYDARVNGGFPPPPGLPAACEGEACQGPLGAPNDPTPSSLAFSGAGNVVQKPARKAHKKKHHQKKRHQKHANDKRTAPGR